MHAIRHRIDPAGVAAIEVAHGDGLAGGSLNYGPGSHTAWEWIEATADAVENAFLTTLLLPGIGTIAELERAHALGVRSIRIATHRTEADISAGAHHRARHAGRTARPLRPGAP